jgi:tetratricopeptide (TPR) repeat protein
MSFVRLLFTFLLFHTCNNVALAQAVSIEEILNRLKFRDFDAMHKSDSNFFYINMLDSALGENNSSNISLVLNRIKGQYYSMDGDYQKALTFYDASLQLAEKKFDRRYKMYLLNDISKVYTSISAYNSAKLYLQKSIDLAKEINDSAYITQEFVGLGKLYYEMNAYDSALLM